MDIEENKNRPDDLAHSGDYQPLEMEEKESLDKGEIDKAEKLISQRYPLNYLAITDVFTFL